MSTKQMMMMMAILVLLPSLNVVPNLQQREIESQTRGQTQIQEQQLAVVNATGRSLGASDDHPDDQRQQQQPPRSRPRSGLL